MCHTRSMVFSLMSFVLVVVLHHLALSHQQPSSHIMAPKRPPPLPQSLFDPTGPLAPGTFDQPFHIPPYLISNTLQALQSHHPLLHLSTRYSSSMPIPFLTDLLLIPDPSFMDWTNRFHALRSKALFRSNSTSRQNQLLRSCKYSPNAFCPEYRVDDAPLSCRLVIHA